MYKNIEELIAGHAVASARLAFFQEWAPDDIYPSICAFATDAYFTGGGHIVIGVETKEGAVTRPVQGMKRKEIQTILKEMAKLDKKLKPEYHAQSFVEQADDKLLLVLYCPTGTGRPYQVPEMITNTKSKDAFFIRENARTLNVEQAYVFQLLNRFYRTGGGASFTQSNFVIKDHAVNMMNAGGAIYHLHDANALKGYFDAGEQRRKAKTRDKKK